MSRLRPASLVATLLTALALGYGVWQCVDLMWACDDAYISMRYARNLVDGHGLIFNPGAPAERVEGYSNFSWTMLLALGFVLGVGDHGMVDWAGWLGLLCHLGTAVLLVGASIRLARAGGHAAVPVAAIGLSCHHHWASLAVCGLETAMFTFLVTALALGAAFGARRPSALVGLGVAAALACLTRPDGAIPATVVGIGLILRSVRERRLAPVLVYGLTAALILVPHEVWRLAYYGEVVPNTAFAKSAGDPYIERGLVYVGWYFRVYWVLGLGGIALLTGLVRRRWRSGADLLAAVCLAYLGFVVWVGGDFMFGRFLLPITPLLYLGFEFLRPQLRSPWAGIALAVGVALATTFVATPSWLDDYRNPYGFSDNRAISHVVDPETGWTRAEASRRAGEMARHVTEGLDFRVALHGSHANLAYYGHFPVAIETAAGLTDEYIAKLPVRTRGMVGHEKTPADYAGYLEERGVAVNFLLSWRGEQGNAVDRYVGDIYGVGTRPLRTFVLRDERYRESPLPGVLVTYQKELMDEIRRRAPYTIFVDFPRWLDEVYLPRLAQLPPARARRDLQDFDRFYFDPNRHLDDPADRERRGAIASRAEGRR